jgi:hypothetical protein
MARATQVANEPHGQLHAMLSGLRDLQVGQDKEARAESTVQETVT